MIDKTSHINHWVFASWLFIFIGFANLMYGQKFSLYSDTTRLRIGEQTVLHLEFVSTNSNWILPNFTDTVGALDVVDPGKWDTVLQRDEMTVSREVRVTAFDTGYYAIQPFKAYRDTDTLLTEGLFFEVLPVDSILETPYDIKNPLDAPKTIWEKLLDGYVYGILPLAAIMTLYYLYTRFARKTEKTDESEVSVSPEEWIVKAFNDMERNAIWSSQPPKQYYDQLTDVLRYFIDRKYSYRTTEMVTDEIEIVLRDIEPFEKHFDELISLLRKADRAKFAKGTYSESVMQSDFTRAREMVEEWIAQDRGERGGEDV